MRANNTTPAITPAFDFASIDLDDIKKEIQSADELANDAKENKGLFKVKTANKWMQQANARPIPQMLFSEFWFEGELCILFADTNLGKSILAVQLADSISSGKPVAGFKLEAERSDVLYFDFELSDKQFENRYSLKFQHHYQFDKGFYRVEINPDSDVPNGQSFEDYLNNSLERAIVETGAKVLIIDNLTYLKNETEKAKDALPLMKHLKALKKKYDLSILALAHTPKRDLSKPLSKNDLQGSKMLMNFCDSCFAIGESATDRSIRYLKQMKQRNVEEMYGTENVVICQIEKAYNFLLFTFIGYGCEREHLKEFNQKDKESLIERVKELSQSGKSQRVISRELGISVGAVNKYLNL